MLQKLSLKGRLLFMTAGLMVMAGLVSALMYLRTSSSWKSQISSSYNLNAENLSNAVAAQFYERYGDVQAFAANEALLSGNPASISYAFDKYISLYGIYDLILFVDMKGRFVASNSKSADGSRISTSALATKDFSKDPWFLAVVSGKTTDDSKKGLLNTYVEDPQWDPLLEVALGGNRLASSFSALVKDKNGHPVGVLTNRADFKWIETDVLYQFNSLKEKGMAHSEILLMDKGGAVFVYHSPHKNKDKNEIVRDKNTLLKLNLQEIQYPPALKIKEGQSNFMEAPSEADKDMQLAAFTPIKSSKFVESLGWSVVVRVDSSQLFGEVTSAQIFYLISVCLISILAIGVSGIWAIQLSGHLQGLTNEISATAQDVEAYGSRLVQASQELSHSATSAAASLEETAASLEELTATVKHNAEFASEASHLSKSGCEVVEGGVEQINKLFLTMKDISESSKKVENIIVVIENIAFQTNLLALNAAVEAARAGQNGKGFAVVAESVRDLAQKSSAAAKDVGQLIKTSVQKTENGALMAEEAGHILQQITKSVRKISEFNSNIAQSSIEQSQSLQQIGKAVHLLDGSTQKNAGVSTEVTTTATEMEAQANTLADVVSRLKVLVKGEEKAT